MRKHLNSAADAAESAAAGENAQVNNKQKTEGTGE